MSIFQKRLTILKRINELESESLRVKFAEKLFSGKIHFISLLKEIKREKKKQDKIWYKNR